MCTIICVIFWCVKYFGVNFIWLLLMLQFIQYPFSFFFLFFFCDSNSAVKIIYSLEGIFVCLWYANVYSKQSLYRGIIYPYFSSWQHRKVHSEVKLLLITLFLGLFNVNSEAKYRTKSNFLLEGFLLNNLYQIYSAVGFSKRRGSSEF